MRNNGTGLLLLTSLLFFTSQAMAVTTINNPKYKYDEFGMTQKVSFSCREDANFKNICRSLGYKEVISVECKIAKVILFDKEAVLIKDDLEPVFTRSDRQLKIVSKISCN